MFARAHAQTTTDPTRFVFDGLDTIRRLQRVDPHSVEQAAAMYSGMVGPFAYGGLSFAISRRFLEAAEPLVPWDDPSELLSYRFFNFLHHFLEGDWSDAQGVDEALLEEGLRLGQLWDVCMYLDLDTERRLYRGEFAKVRERIEELGKIADLYQHDLAKAEQRGLHALPSSRAERSRSRPGGGRTLLQRPPRGLVPRHRAGGEVQGAGAPR